MLNKEKINLKEEISKLEKLSGKKVLLKDSVRHGMFPYFSVNRKTLEISTGTVSSDLAVSAVFENRPNPSYYSFCDEGWGMNSCEAAAKMAQEMVKKGASDEETDEVIYNKYTK